MTAAAEEQGLVGASGHTGAELGGADQGAVIRAHGVVALR